MAFVDTLKLQYLRIARIIGLALICQSVLILSPLVSVPFYLEDARFITSFFIPSLLSLAVGYPIFHFTKQYKGVLTSIDAGVLVVFIWILAFFFCALPFTLSGELDFVDALFESVSGWTTTGLSMVDVSNCPKVFLLWRSLMQFYGGVGLVAVLILALSGPLGIELFSAEGHTDRLAPNLKHSVSIMLKTYVGYVVAGVVLYCIAGMSPFDAINHSMAAISTGGFSTKVDSIGAYDSFPIEFITIILMLIGTTNFGVHLLIVKGDFKRILKIGEVRFMFLILFLSIASMFIWGIYGQYPTIFKEIRVSMFEIVSAMSTSGFSSVSYSHFRPFAILIMIVVMVIGGGAGSTAGGIKLYRVYVLAKSLMWNLIAKFEPSHRVNEDYIYKPEGKFYVNDKYLNDLFLFATSYLFVYLIGVLVVCHYGYSIGDAMFEIASCMSTVGLSVGVTAPTAAFGVKVIEMICMFFGRLEFFIIYFTVIKLYKDFKFFGGFFKTSKVASKSIEKQQKSDLT